MHSNLLDNLTFLNNLDSGKLIYLNISSNDFSPQDLSVFSRFTNLEYFHLGGTSFYGNLESLKKLINLWSLDISHTNIEEGLESLPNKLNQAVLWKKEERGLKKELMPYCKVDLSLWSCYVFQLWKKNQRGYKLLQERIFGINPSFDIEKLIGEFEFFNAKTGEFQGNFQFLTSYLEKEMLLEKKTKELFKLELKIKELTSLIEEQKQKIVEAYLRFATSEEQKLIKELVTKYLEYTKFKKQAMNSSDYEEKCEDYDDQCKAIKKNLRTRLNKETMNSVQRIITDCENLVNWEIELENNHYNQAKLLGYSNQSIDNNEKSFRNDELLISPRKKIIILNENENKVIAKNLPANIYQLSLEFLKTKDYFYLARKNTLKNLQIQIQELEKTLNKKDKAGSISEFIVSVGCFTRFLDYGITKIVGKSLKSSSDLLKTFYISSQGKKIHLTFKNSEEEILNNQEIHFAYSQLNSALNGNKDHDLFGILDNLYHSAFKSDYHLYDILKKQVNIWPDRKLNQERLEQIYRALQTNLSMLDQEINEEFCKLKSDDQTQIRKENEERIENNQVVIINQEQRVKELTEQIDNKEKELEELIKSIKSKLESKNFLASERTKITRERHNLLDKFLQTEVIESDLNKVAKGKKINLQAITETKKVIKKIQEKLDKLNFQQSESVEDQSPYLRANQIMDLSRKFK
ncbi:MAG: hypothetical protein LBR43_00340 [Spiroplasmataceae bacterium]|nr:hypothetical protein [Spiroplasmataceae bacterium]